MSLDVNAIHNFSMALASAERDRVNEGKKVNQNGWKSKAKMRKEAAQTTGAIVFYIVFFTALYKLLKFLFDIPLRLFGRNVGIIINVVVITLLIAILLIAGAVSGSERRNASQAEEQRKVLLECAEQETLQQKTLRRKEQEQNIANTKRHIEEYRVELREKLVDSLTKKGFDNKQINSVVSRFDNRSNLKWQDNELINENDAMQKVRAAYESIAIPIENMPVEVEKPNEKGAKTRRLLTSTAIVEGAKDVLADQAELSNESNVQTTSDEDTISPDDRESIDTYINDALELSCAKAEEMMDRVRACGCEEFVPIIQYDFKKLQKKLAENSRMRMQMRVLAYDVAKAKVDAEIKAGFSSIVPLVKKAEEKAARQY